jgi:hypothetical protein
MGRQENIARSSAALSREQLEQQLALQRGLFGSFNSGGGLFTGGFPRGFTLEEFGFQGPVVPPASELEQRAFLEGGQFGTEASPVSVARLDALNQQLSGTPAFTFDPAVEAARFQQQVADPELRRLRTETIPQLATQFLPGGQTGAAARAGARAISDATTNISAQRAGFLADRERLAAQLTESALGRQAGAIGQGRAEEQARLEALLNIGGIQRGIAGQQNVEQLNRALLQQPFSDPRIPFLPQFAQTPAGVGGQSLLGGIGQLAGGLGQGLAGLGSIV